VPWLADWRRIIVVAVRSSAATLFVASMVAAAWCSGSRRDGADYGSSLTFLKQRISIIVAPFD